MHINRGGFISGVTVWGVFLRGLISRGVISGIQRRYSRLMGNGNFGVSVSHMATQVDGNS